jgi:hypothetical protein
VLRQNGRLGKFACVVHNEITNGTVGAPKPTISKNCARILRAHAREIQKLGRRAVRDVVEIGRRLSDAKRRVGHGKFLTWIAIEFGWSERSAENFMRVYDLSLKSANFADLNLPVSALYLLAAPSTPDTALVAVAVRAGTGNGLSLAEVKDIVVNARRNSPLRFLANAALRILNEAENAADIERLLAELSDVARPRVAYILRNKCLDRMGRLDNRVDRLRREIERLELINNLCQQTMAIEKNDPDRDAKDDAWPWPSIPDVWNGLKRQPISDLPSEEVAS